MARKPRGVGAVVGRSTDTQAESMRDQIVDGEGPGLDLTLDSADRARKASSTVKSTKPTRSKTGKKLRNHEIDIDYFRALDEILARSYVKQEAAHNIVEAFTRMMESRGIEAPFEDERFERAAGNMAVVGMMREMAWAFGLGPDLADRIAEHTVDKLFSPGQAKGPEVRKT
jgi:hypothetical protein